jgi:ribokinase
MTRFAIAGYASLDYIVNLDGALSADRTTLIRARPDWGALGGSPSYVGRAMAAEGVSDVALISWVGADAEGDHYRALLRQARLDAEGVESRPGPTPVAILAYQPDGGCVCMYDPGRGKGADISAAQRAIVAVADWVCVTVGPPAATRSILAAARPDARVVWAVKNDPGSMPADVVAALAARADVISCSRGEAAYVGEALSAAPARARLLIETLGADGARASWQGGEATVGVERVDGANATGAGDSFIGGLIVGLAGNFEDPAAAMRRGAEAARRMLLERRDTND